jgi:hypothetical protein
LTRGDDAQLFRWLVQTNFFEVSVDAAKLTQVLLRGFAQLVGFSS